MIGILIMLISIGLISTMTAEKLMHDQWYASDSYQQKKMVDRAKLYKNISTLSLTVGVVLCMYLFFKL